MAPGRIITGHRVLAAMGLWSRLFCWRGSDPTTDTGTTPADETAPNTVELPAEPFMFECQSCGKVFEARRRRPQCPECDSRDVSQLTA